MPELVALDSGQRLPGVADDAFAVSDGGRDLGWVVRHHEASARAGWAAISAGGGCVGRGLSRRHDAVAALEAR